MKGIDDLLAAGRKPRRLIGIELDNHLTAQRTKLFGKRAKVLWRPAAAIDVEDEVRPEFPVEVFSPKVENYIRRVATAMGCPIDFVALAALVNCGAAIGAARSLRLKGGYFEKPGLYAVIISRPGTAKTPALKAVMKPIYEQQDRLYEEYKAARKQYEQELETYKEAKRKHKDEEPEPKQPEEPAGLRHIFVNDTTVESLAANLEENRKGLLLFRDELTAWVRSLDMYKGRGTDRQFFLSAWSGEMVKVDRKYSQGRPIIIPHPFVSVLGSIQPDLLTELEAEGGKEDGFIHRILFSYPAESPASLWTEDEISEEDEREWQLVVDKLLNLQPNRPEGGSERPKSLNLSADGRREWTELHNKIVIEMNSPDTGPEMYGPLSKLKGYCARFALIIHMIRVVCGEAGNGQDEGEVDAEDIRRAAKLYAYFKAQLNLVYPRMRQSKEDAMVARLVEWMGQKNLSRVTPRDICRANLCGIKKTSEAERLMRAAIDQGFGEAESDPGKAVRAGGSQSRVFVLRST
jgi:hypothetical protein